MATGFELATKLQVLGAARNPQWTQQTTSTTPPKSSSDGVALLVDGGLPGTVAGLQVLLREDVSARTVRLTPTPGGGGTVFSFYADGLVATPVSYTEIGGDTAEDIVDGLIAALGLEANHNALLTASREGSGASSVLKLVGKSTTHYVLVSVNATAGDLTGVGDAMSCSLIVFGQRHQINRASSADTVPITAWSRVALAAEPASITGVQRDGVYVDFDGYTDNLLTAGVQRLFCQLKDLTGSTALYTEDSDVTVQAEVWIGPCATEGA